MLISSIISTQEYGFERQGKFILLTQFILPVFAFVLGQLYPTESISKLIFERILFYFLAVIIPAQLLFSWFQGSLLLSPYLYLFSIYQYLQYVPVIFVCVYLFTVYTLWETPKLKRILCVYASIMGVYAAASLSMLAIIALLSGLLGFVFYHCKHKFDKLTVVVLFLALFSSWGYLQFAKSHAAFVDKYEVIYDQMPTEQKTSKNTDDRMPTEQKALKNLTARFQYWRFYADNIISRLDTFFLGHGRPPDRYRYPSAHNYYLDLTYNFGFLALLPLLVIIGFTLKLIVQFRRDIFSSSSLVGLTFVVLFLLFFDNSLKVGLRQPYPGIITFFLWGILLSRLLAFRQRVKPNSAPT